MSTLFSRLVFTLLTCCTVSLCAQSPQATIFGIVTGATGAVVPGVR